MQTASMEYIISTVFRTNILPVISECNTSCSFCSHKQNPGTVEVFRMPRLQMDDFCKLIDFLSPGRKIIIGEAASRIVEGEPLLHRDFFSIVSQIRARYPDTDIQITTNGLLLTRELVVGLAGLGNIELNLSVNAIAPDKRKRLLGERKPVDIREKLELLKGRLRYSGSFVFIPDVLMQTDVEELVLLLDDYGAQSVRAFLPGYTRLSGRSDDLNSMRELLKEWLDELRGRLSIPVIIEPSLVDDLTCRVEGVIPDSPAAAAGIREGDILVRVNESPVLTRVDGFDRAYRSAEPLLTFRRGMQENTVKLRKKRNYSPGFIVAYDIDPAVIGQIDAAVKRNRAERPLLITSRMAFPMLQEILAYGSDPCTTTIIAADNAFFGGNIQCAGLLTLQDIEEAAVRYMVTAPAPDLILIPPVMFDHRGTDLLGRRVKDAQERLGITVDMV